MDFKPQLWQQPFVASLSPWLKPSLIMKQTTFSGFDKQMDVVNLYTSAGHSPACFWIGGYESDAENMVFTWNISARVMDKYFIEWESGYPKNRWIETKLTGPARDSFRCYSPSSSRSGGNEETSKNLSNCCVTLLPWIRQIQFWTLCSDIPPSPRRVCVSGSDTARCLNYPQSQILTKLSIIGQNAKLPPARPMIINNCQFLGQNVKFIN